MGGGLTLPYVDGNRNDFFNKNGNRAGYNLTTEGRYYFMPNFALGLQYDYLRIAHSPDKMHLHYIHPNITYRYLWSNGNQGVFPFIRYRLYELRGAYILPEKYQEKDFFSIEDIAACQSAWVTNSIFRKKISGVFRADILTADWFANPDARLYNPDDYDDGIDHSWFKNNITFFNIGFAIQFGR